MKCIEVKNLIIEATNLNELLEETGIKSHLKSCKSCQEKYQFEKKIRLGFLSIAEEAPPISLVKNIMEIQDSHETVSLWAKIQSIFFSFTFKVSFASCLTGFLLALVISHYDHSAIMHENKLLKAEHKQLENKNFAMKKRKKKVVVKETNKVALKEQSKAKVQLQLTDNSISYSGQEPIEEKVVYSIASKESDWSQLSEKPTIAQQNEREIPESNYSIQKVKADTGKQKMEFAMAPRPVISKSSKMARAVVYNKNSIKREKKQLVDKALVTAFDSNIEIESEALDSDNLIGFNEAGEELSASETIATQIENLILKNNIQVSSGPISVKDWAIQGIITAQECKKMLPPYGKRWFVEKNGNQIKVVLKED